LFLELTAHQGPAFGESKMISSLDDFNPGVSTKIFKQEEDELKLCWKMIDQNYELGSQNISSTLKPRR